MLVHQIFIDIGQGKTFRDNPIYCTCYEKNKSFLEGTEFNIKIWNEKEIDELIKDLYPEYLPFIKSFPNPFYKIDFVRPLILHSKGGIYLDMDNILLEVPNLKSDYYIGIWRREWKNEFNNDILYFNNRDIYLNYVNFMIFRTANCKMPESWKVRRFLYCVGAKCFNQFCKKEGYKTDSKIIYKVYSPTLSWLACFNKKLIK